MGIIFWEIDEDGIIQKSISISSDESYFSAEVLRRGTHIASLISETASDWLTVLRGKGAELHLEAFYFVL